MKVTDKIELYNCDNMELMAKYPDGYFDLAIVDPPYGIGVTKNKRLNNNSNNDWDDNIPSEEYFKELFRVSKNQIIWGGNYFDLPPTRCFIVWDKCISDDFTLAMAELAWTSFDKLAKIFKYSVPKDGKIHPTQKPVKLYKWILDKYSTCSECGGSGEVASNTIDCDVQTCKKCKGDNPKILDTHLGSASIAIACHDYGFELVGCELDKEYYDKGIERVKNHVSQQKLF